MYCVDLSSIHFNSSLVGMQQKLNVGVAHRLRLNVSKVLTFSETH